MNNQLDKTTQTVGVVLVNWNGAEFTIPCIESLLAGVVKPERLIVVDNASHDNSTELIMQRFPEIELILNKENVGFTGANNVGVNSLISSGCDYIWILNNDTIVEENCLFMLKNYMDRYSDVSACSGKILYVNSDRLIWYAGAIYNRWTLRFTHRGVGDIDVGQYDRVEEVPFLSGCCMFIRRDAILRIGMFDDHFFAYNEDGDWCLRAMKADLRLLYIPQAVIWHKVSATVNKLKKQRYGGSTSPFSVYITNRNRFYILRKHSSSMFQACIALLFHIAWFCYYAGALLMLFRIDKFCALVMSVNDGITLPLDDSHPRISIPRYLQTK